jgi:hypothetical protein
METIRTVLVAWKRLEQESSVFVGGDDPRYGQETRKI